MSHRRRGPGISRNSATQKMAQKKADEMKAVSLQTALDTVQRLEVKLTDFAQKHQKEFMNDPVFRKRFLDMCAPLGIDPLASSHARNNKNRDGKNNLWNGLFHNMGDYYHALAVKVAEVCLAHRSTNGGMMSLTAVQHILQQRRTRLGTALGNTMNHTSATTRTTSTFNPFASRRSSSNTANSNNHNTSNLISASDIQVAIAKLSKLGGGFRTIQVGSNLMIVSVPMELDQDHTQVLNVAAAASASTQSGISIATVQEALPNWTRERADRALTLLLQQGMAWLDDEHPEEKGGEGTSWYWFSSIWQAQQASSSELL